MSVFAISDLHLSGGGSINKSMDLFGEKWRGHVSRIEREWRAVVSAGDTVVVGGDISWAMTLDDVREDLHFIDSLPGEKIIIEGNHDYWWPTSAKLKAFLKAEDIKTIRPLSGSAFLRDGIVICGTRGWFFSSESQKKAFDADYDRVASRETRRLTSSIEAGLSLSGGNSSSLRVFLHFPAAFSGEYCAPLMNVLRSYSIRRVYFGHIHGTYSYPLTYEAGGIEHCTTAADYLAFVPRIVF